MGASANVCSDCRFGWPASRSSCPDEGDVAVVSYLHNLVSPD